MQSGMEDNFRAYCEAGRSVDFAWRHAIHECRMQEMEPGEPIVGDKGNAGTDPAAFGDRVC